MSIALSTRFTRHAWAMPPIPGLPSGVWSASNDDEGDGTGGIMSFQHIFRNQSNNLGDTNLYNIEQIMIAGQDSSQVGASLTINGMDPGTGQTSSVRPIDRVFAFLLVNMDVAAGIFTNAILPGEPKRPIWVGTYNGVDTDLGDMIIKLQNFDSKRVLVAVYGYYWAPGAVNAASGIRRPIDGIFGA